VIHHRGHLLRVMHRARPCPNCALPQSVVEAVRPPHLPLRATRPARFDPIPEPKAEAARPARRRSFLTFHPPRHFLPFEPEVEGAQRRAPLRQNSIVRPGQNFRRSAPMEQAARPADWCPPQLPTSGFLPWCPPSEPKAEEARLWNLFPVMNSSVRCPRHFPPLASPVEAAQPAAPLTNSSGRLWR
jgi:hypothetical protein